MEQEVLADIFVVCFRLWFSALLPPLFEIWFNPLQIHIVCKIKTKQSHRPLIATWVPVPIHYKFMSMPSMVAGRTKHSGVPSIGTLFIFAPWYPLWPFFFHLLCFRKGIYATLAFSIWVHRSIPISLSLRSAVDNREDFCVCYVKRLQQRSRTIIRLITLDSQARWSSSRRLTSVAVPPFANDSLI